MDREKVIKAIETHISTVDSVGCDDCTYENDGWCMTRVLSDALTLLKAQSAVKPIYNEEKYGDHLPHCGNCEKVLPNNAVYGKVNFCHYCGQVVKSDD